MRGSFRGAGRPPRSAITDRKAVQASRDAQTVHHQECPESASAPLHLVKLPIGILKLVWRRKMANFGLKLHHCKPSLAPHF